MVTAVVVAHDGARWLPEVLAAVAAQTRPPDVVVAADTGSTDTSPELLRAVVGGDRLAALDPGTGFGAAAQAALALAGSAPPDAGTRWVWLLHDDCVPDPGALAALLAEAGRDPAIAVVGPKLRALADRRLLLEVGVTIARGGRRETLLERREYDQGQHDGVHDVLAVSTAGMLVRRDVWDALGGLDPHLPLLRDDVDLGWRARLAGHRVVCATDAVAYHAEATARGSRRAPAVGRRLRRVDRAHATYVLLANLPVTRLPGTLLALILAALLRALGDLAGKAPGRAADEVAALATVLGRPGRLVRARVVRRRTRAVPARSVLPLLARRGAGWRHAVDAFAAAVGAGMERVRREPERPGTAAPATGPVSEQDEDLPSWGAGLARRLLLRPPVLLVAGLAVLAAVAARGLVGDGRLMGGALLPAPAGAADLWRTYLASWHPVGIGGDAIAPPYLAVLALLASVLGSAERAVTLLLLGAVPMAGLSAYAVARRLVGPVPLRVWAAVSYALLPPVVGAVAAGRLGTAALAVLLPVTGLVTARALGLAGGRAQRALWPAVLLLAVMAAFVPMTVPVVAALAVLATAVVRGRARLRLVALALGPPLLLLPWWPAVADDPGLLLRESGLPGPGLSETDLAPVAMLLLHPGGPGLPPLLLTAGLLLAGLGALLRVDRRRPVLAGWVLVVAGLAVAVLTARSRLTGPTLETPVAAWPGPGTLLAGAGLLLAATVGAQGAAGRVARSSFGWRQPSAALAVVLAGLWPVLAAGWWAVAGASGPLTREDPVLLPAFVAAEGSGPDRPRTLVLRARPDGALGYALLRADGPRLGHAELSPPGDGGTRLGSVVADLASGRGGDAAARLVPYAVRFVLLTRPVDPAVARAVDAVPGVVRVAGPSGAVLWRIDYPTGRLRVLPPDAAVSDPEGAPPPGQVLPAGQVEARAEVPAGVVGRLLVLADPVDRGWRAHLDGVALEPTTYDGWAQAFVLPAGGGELTVRHDGGLRPLLLWAQLGLFVAVVVLALPAARLGDDAEVAS